MPHTTASTPSTRTVVLTGATGGMGRATAAWLTAKGWQVLGLGQRTEALAALADTLGPRFTPLAGDLREPTLVDSVLERLSDLPPLTGLVNLAGVSQGGRLDTLTDADWQAAFDINVTPSLRLIRGLSPQMQQRGAGSIVNVGSPVGVVGARKPQYAASKAALHGLTMSCARTLGPHGVRVNLLLPGPTLGGMTSDWSDAQREQVAQGTLLKRLCQPEEVARVIAFLLGEDSSHLTASVLDMTAGSMMGHA
jgi:NAD(P)-dependent dehydrogenase (short-subunit alcohol dehydrogenase family)